MPVVWSDVLCVCACSYIIMALILFTELVFHERTAETSSQFQLIKDCAAKAS